MRRRMRRTTTMKLTRMLHIVATLDWVGTETCEELRRRGEDEEDEKQSVRRCAAYDEYDERDDDNYDTD